MASARQSATSPVRSVLPPRVRCGPVLQPRRLGRPNFPRATEGQSDNKVDIAYLYYLPFCHVFASNDKLHKRVVPLFLREDQSFVFGENLKADLQQLDVHFSALPEADRNLGFYKIAPTPPEDASFLVTQLWDKHLPGWRQLKQKVKHERNPEEEKKIVAELNRIQEAAASSDPRERLTPEQTQFLQIKRNVLRRKGKWTRYPPDI